MRDDLLGRPASNWRGDFFAAILTGVAVLGFCFVLLWHNPLLFWNDDYEISIIPVFADVARSWSEGHLPLLSPYSWVCSNLAGEFQYGTFSIFVNAAVVLIWKFALTFPQQAAALSMTHLFALAMGAYLLARGRNLSAPLSVMVAFVATLNGWIMCWGATDWFGALGAWTWLPWAWWGLERALDPRRGPWRFLWPAPFVYLLVTGGFPYTVGMLGLLIAWLALKSLVQTKKLSALLPMLFGAMLGFGLSAPAWLALIEHIRGSAREVDPASAHFQWLVPLTALPGFILPVWTVKWVDFSTRYVPHIAMELACGLVPPVVLAAGLIGCGRKLVRRIKWELLLLGLVLVFSMMPSTSVFRWSFRWLPLFHLLLAMCAAEAMRLLDYEEVKGPVLKTLLSRPSILALVVANIVTPIYFATHAPGFKATLFVSFTFVLSAVWFFADARHKFRQTVSWTPTAVVFFSLLVLYLCLPTNGGVPKYNLSQKLLSPAPLDPQRLYLSLYPPPETAYGYPTKPLAMGMVVRPGSTSMWAGLHFVNGYSPVRPAGVARALSFYVHGDIDSDAANYLLGSQAGREGELAKIGVDGIVVANEVQLIPKPETEWELVHSDAEGRVYHRRGGTFARIRSVAVLDSKPNEQFSIAELQVVEDSRNRVLADVAVPSNGSSALLTFSRPFFRGYQARIGSTTFAVDSYRGLFPTVEVPSGIKGRLSLVFHPWWLTWGGTLSAISLLILLSPLLLKSRGSSLRSK